MGLLSSCPSLSPTPFHPLSSFPSFFLSCLYLCCDHFSSFSLPQYVSLHTSPQFISLLSVLVTAAGCLLMFSGADKLFHTSNSPLPSSSSPAGILNLLFFLSPTDSVSFCFLFLTTTYRPIIVARTQNTPSTDWLQGMCYFLIYMCVWVLFPHIRALTQRSRHLSKLLCIKVLLSFAVTRLQLLPINGAVN